MRSLRSLWGHLETAPSFGRDREAFARAFATRVNELCADEALARRMGDAGRKRVEENFAWSSIAKQTTRLYESLVAKKA